MRSANIRALRAGLSRWLEAVKAGETIEIRDRDEPIARIVPIEGYLARRGLEISPRVRALSRAGVIRLGVMKGVREILWQGPLQRPTAGVLDALVADRGRNP